MNEVLNSDLVHDEIMQRLEAGERPGPLVRHAGPELRHEIALRWFFHRNEQLGRVVRELGMTAREPDPARVITELKSGRCQLAPGTRPTCCAL